MSSIFEAFAKSDAVYQSIKLNLNKFTNRVNFSIPEGVTARVSPEFAEVLGFTPYQLLEGEGVARYTHDIHRGVNLVYVYCNVVDSQIVGDVYAPLLRTVAVKGGYGDVISEIFDRPHYVNVNTDEVSMIEINIKDDTGTDLSFQFGKVLCKLHFRQKSI